MGKNLDLEFSPLTDVGRMREANEDNMGHAEYPWGQVFTVCDGMGGHVGGATASRIAVSSLLEFFARNDAADPSDLLNKAIHFANEQIYATALNQPALKGMGTTCVILLQKESELWLAHVGDSRIYIFTDGQLHKLTRDHSFVQGLVDEGLIAEEAAEEHPRKNELMRAMGIGADIKVEVTKDPIFPKQGDVFLLCSDGLNGMIGDRNIEEILKKRGMLGTRAQLLIDAANAAGGKDNITVQLVEVLDSPHLSNRYVAIKPPINMARTMPVQEAVTFPVDTRTILQRYWVGLVFFGVILVAGIIGMVMYGGGPSAAELRAQAVKDSTHIADSLDGVAEDSVAKAREEYRADSTFRADSTAKADLEKKKPTKAPK